ncbi:hypothetical protein Peur_071081 [Populus x canadensis]
MCTMRSFSSRFLGSLFLFLFCLLQLECFVSGAVAVEDGDLEKNSQSVQVVVVVASWRLAFNSDMVDEEWYYGCACVTGWSSCHGVKRDGAVPVETWRNWPQGEEVATLGDGSMTYNASKLEIGLWWPFFC